MSKKKPRNTKSKIIAAAWKLFYEQGYDDTTIDEIIAESATSKGSFYHYFEGKDALLGSLSFLFDEKYMELEAQLSGFATRYEQLIYLNQELFSMIENSISLDLLARLLSTQLITKGEKHLLDRNRCSDGFDALAAKGQLGLSLEALATDKRFTALFTDEQANTALGRLLDAGYYL